MKFISYLLFILIFKCHCQTYDGQIYNQETNSPIPYVNIGVLLKNNGTTSDQHGNFKLDINSQYYKDTIVFSSIGFKTYKICCEDFINLPNKLIKLKEESYKLEEVLIKPKNYKKKRYGHEYKSRAFVGGFKNNNLGYECGSLLKINKQSKLNSINFTIASCTYDTIFYRVNIYKKINDKFINILTKPIYVEFSKKEIKENLKIDISNLNIFVDIDCLITLEHVKDLGDGHLWFCARYPRKTYYRKTSQGIWKTAPVGISLFVEADVVN